VTIENFDRGTAEQKYGFRIYQGGMVPVKSVRVVSVGDFDVEACGGTHVKSTKEVDLIKIKRTKRIQDGVVRIEFVAGEAAHEYVKDHKVLVTKMSAEQKAKEERDKLREQRKQESRKIILLILEDFSIKNIGTEIDTTIGPDVKLQTSKAGKFCFAYSDPYDEFFHLTLGKELIKKDPNLVYFGIFVENNLARVIVFAGDAVLEGKNAKAVVVETSKMLGGSGGGNATFAQGGGKNSNKQLEAIAKAKSMVLE